MGAETIFLERSYSSYIYYSGRKHFFRVVEVSRVSTRRGYIYIYIYIYIYLHIYCGERCAHCMPDRQTPQPSQAKVSLCRSLPSRWGACPGLQCREGVSQRLGAGPSCAEWLPPRTSCRSCTGSLSGPSAGPAASRRRPATGRWSSSPSCSGPGCGAARTPGCASPGTPPGLKHTARVDREGHLMVRPFSRL